LKKIIAVFAEFILHTTYYILHTTYYILHTTYYILNKHIFLKIGIITLPSEVRSSTQLKFWSEV